MLGRRFVAGTAVVGAMLVSMAAQAQTYPPPPPPGGGYGAPPPGYAPAPQPPPPGVQREGLMFGISLGWGAIQSSDCSDCEDLAGLGLALHIGGMLNPRLAIMFDGSGVGHPIENADATLVHAVDTIAAQYWVSDSIWIKGGIGFGQLSIQYSDGTQDESELGGAVMGAVGIEVLQGRNFTLDVQLRGAAANYDTEFGGSVTLSNGYILIGANWY